MSYLFEASKYFLCFHFIIPIRIMELCLSIFKNLFIHFSIVINQLFSEWYTIVCHCCLSIVSISLLVLFCFIRILLFFFNYYFFTLIFSYLRRPTLLPPPLALPLLPLLSLPLHHPLCSSLSLSPLLCPPLSNFYSLVHSLPVPRLPSFFLFFIFDLP